MGQRWDKSSRVQLTLATLEANNGNAMILQMRYSCGLILMPIFIIIWKLFQGFATKYGSIGPYINLFYLVYILVPSTGNNLCVKITLLGESEGEPMGSHWRGRREEIRIFSSTVTNLFVWVMDLSQLELELRGSAQLHCCLL